jgi:tetratricopeptide (TPR) repeat protein
MAMVLDNQGKYDEALGIQEEVLNTRERVLGAEHPDTLMTRHNMALVLGRQGKYDEALGIYEEVLSIEEHVLGAEHPSTQKTRNNMAFTLNRKRENRTHNDRYQTVSSKRSIRCSVV